MSTRVRRAGTVASRLSPLTVNRTVCSISLPPAVFGTLATSRSGAVSAPAQPFDCFLSGLGSLSQEKTRKLERAGRQRQAEREHELLLLQAPISLPLLSQPLVDLLSCDRQIAN